MQTIVFKRRKLKKITLYVGLSGQKTETSQQKRLQNMKLAHLFPVFPLLLGFLCFLYLDFLMQLYILKGEVVI